MPSYNHTRGDGPDSPYLVCEIELILEGLGVVRACSQSDNYRWSRSDLATDLADKLEKSRRRNPRELLLYLIGVAQQTEEAEVWRALFAEMWGNS